MQQELDIHIHIDEDTDQTLAFLELNLRGEHFESTGRAKRNPLDRPMPVVGEELAVARALSGLTTQVMDAAHNKIDQFLSVTQ